MYWVKERGLLYGIGLISRNSIFDYWFCVYFGTATYVDYLTFSHLNPITNPTPLPNTTLTIRAAMCTLTIRAAARNPNYWGCRTPSWLALRARGLGFALAVCTMRSQQLNEFIYYNWMNSFILHCKNKWIHLFCTAKNIWIHTLNKFILVWIHIFEPLNS